MMEALRAITAKRPRPAPRWLPAALASLLLLMGTRAGLADNEPTGPRSTDRPGQTSGNQTGPRFDRFGSLPGTVNTSRNEFGASFTRDGKWMFFNSNRGNGRFQNLYSAQLVDGRWGNVKALTELNSRFNDETPFVSPDGRFMFFSSDRDGSLEMPKDSCGRIRVSYDIYWSQKTKNGWASPQRIPGRVNTIHHERSPSFDEENQILYYSSWRFGDSRQIRIMRALLKKGDFVEPEPLPKHINAGYRETAPTTSRYRSGIYFSSQRPGGLGGYDLYFSSYENGVYGQPVNLGPEVNSPAHEFFFHRVNQSLFFCSNRPGGRGRYDVLTFSLPANLKYAFRVVDAKTGKPVQARVQLRGKIGSGPPFESDYKTNAEGRVSATLDSSAKDLHLEASAPAYLPLTEKVSGRSPEQIIRLVPVEADGSFEVHAVRFDFNSARIQSRSHAYLDMLANYLKSNPELRFQIIGHTDLHGGAAFNQKLSLARARAVRDYLVGKGLPADRFETLGAGKSRPLVPKLGRPHDARNRRTEFRRIPPKT